MVSQDQMKQARNMDLVDYLKRNGYRLLKSGAKEYRLAEHDSLVISNNKWHWKSWGIGGNTLDFLIKYEGKTLPEAAAILTGQPQRCNQITAGTQYKPYEDVQTIEKTKELIISSKHPDFYNRVFAYLNRTRRIDKEILYEMFNQGKIYESATKHNCVFVGTDPEGKIRFSAERGTLPGKAYRRDCPGSDKHYGFTIEGKSNQVYVFEAAIDALSHATLYKLNHKEYKKDYRLALDGVEPLSLIQFLKDRPQIQEVVLCLDNDAVGRAASAKIMDMLIKKGYKVLEEISQKKDFNEDLVFFMSRRMERVR